MKALKVIGSIFFSILAFVLLISLSLSLIVKNVVQKELVPIIVKEVVIENIMNIENVNSTKVDEVNKLLESTEVYELTDDVINEFINYINDSNYKVSQKTIEKIINFIINNRELINSFIDYEVSEEELKSREFYNEVEKSSNEIVVSSVKELDYEFIEGVKIYSSLTSSNVQIYLLTGVIICIGIIALINHSTYIWMIYFGIVSLISGLLMSLLHIFMKAVFKSLYESHDLTILLEVKTILLIGITEIIIGIIFIVVKNVIDKNINSNTNKQIQTGF